MANEEHLRILKQGAEVWNQWRQENLEIKPDLSEANLYGKYIGRVNLWGHAPGHFTGLSTFDRHGY